MAKLSLNQTSEGKLKFTLLVWKGEERTKKKVYSTRAKHLGGVIIAFTMVRTILFSNLYHGDEKWKLLGNKEGKKEAPEANNEWLHHNSYLTTDCASKSQGSSTGWIPKLLCDRKIPGNMSPTDRPWLLAEIGLVWKTIFNEKDSVFVFFVENCKIFLLEKKCFLCDKRNDQTFRYEMSLFG